ncbi:Vitamin K-dependent protein C (Fragment) [Seminavis robusta]|uniref:Vitamin K-dependent protein C n=1 Tax=Seminavis robusta TaxID=568900 RepID=A0A9N8DZM1_9STRA
MRMPIAEPSCLKRRRRTRPSRLLNGASVLCLFAGLCLPWSRPLSVLGFDLNLNVDVDGTSTSHGSSNTPGPGGPHQGSYFLIHGGHRPEALNPSKLDAAFSTNFSRKAIGSDKDGYFDFGLGPRNGTTGQLLFHENESGNATNQDLSDPNANLFQAGEGASGSNSSRKAIGSNANGLSYDPANQDLSDPNANLFQDGEGASGSNSSKGDHDVPENATTSGDAKKPVINSSFPNKGVPPAPLPKPKPNVTTATETEPPIPDEDTPAIGWDDEDKTNKKSPINPPGTSLLHGMGHMSTHQNTPSSVTKPGGNSVAANVPLNIGTGSDMFDFSFYNPFEVKIVGGDIVSKQKAKSKYPFYALWQDANCGGSVVHDDIILTAAHCGFEELDKVKQQKTFYLLTTKHGQGMKRELVDTRLHEEYGAEYGNENDLRIVRIRESALVEPFTDKPTGVELVELNRDRRVPEDGSDLEIVGFGLTEEDGTAMSKDLYDVTVQKVPWETCNDQYGDDVIIDKLMICAGAEGGGKDACQGDSGGPVLDKKSQKQVAVVSFGNGCAKADFAGVNVRLSSALGWIDESICWLSRTPPATCHPYIAKWGDCIGTLIAADIVLTAGNCGHWETDPLVNKQVSFPANPNIKRNVVERAVPPEFNYYTKDADVQLLKLETSALVDGKRRRDTGLFVAPLRRNTNTPPFGLFEVSTLNNARVNDDGISNLQQISLESVTGSACPVPNAVGDDKMCTVVAPDGDNPQAQTCKSLPGSPVLDDDWNVVAVNSFGKTCDNPSLGGASTKISSVGTWIDAKICEWTDYRKPSEVLCKRSAMKTSFEQNGPGAFVVTVKHDKFPEDVSWRLLHEASSTELYFQAYDKADEACVTVTERFEHLPAGTYRLDISDKASTGLCCDYGYESISINNMAGESIWKHNNGAGEYHAVEVHVDADGAVSVSDDLDTYITPGAITTQGNMRLYTRDPETFDTLWPGLYPDTMGKLVVNVKLDMFPDETSWDLALIDGDSETSMLSMKGGIAGEVSSNPVDLVPGGVYGFYVRDAGGDGICCKYRNGFVTLTKKISGQEKKVAYRNNGDFGSELDVYFQVSEDGRTIDICKTKGCQ